MYDKSYSNFNWKFTVFRPKLVLLMIVWISHECECYCTLELYVQTCYNHQYDYCYLKYLLNEFSYGYSDKAKTRWKCCLTVNLYRIQENNGNGRVSVTVKWHFWTKFSTELPANLRQHKTKQIDTTTENPLRVG